ncbi:MAG: hypothetical protein P8M53_09880 [Pirellulales bacterium]|nr:hypothetical protein [Pirellulales bacterium]
MLLRRMLLTRRNTAFDHLRGIIAGHSNAEVSATDYGTEPVDSIAEII